MKAATKRKPGNVKERRKVDESAVSPTKIKKEVVSPSKVKKEADENLGCDTPYVNGGVTELSDSKPFLAKEIDDEMAWKSFKCAKSQLNLEIVLKCGQSFRWSLHPHQPQPGVEPKKAAAGDSKQFIGVLDKKVWILTQNEDTIFYKTISNGDRSRGHLLEEKNMSSDEISFLKDYFQLQVDLVSLYDQWSKVDPMFKDVSVQFSGVRMLRQDPVENIFAFICSSNNNIQRISGMVENLCSKYGERVATICTDPEAKSDGDGSKTYYSFPELECLAAAADRHQLESDLRSMGFGYRAAYVSKTAQQLREMGGRDYLTDVLRTKSYDEAKAELLRLTGVGPKVADCILLMSLDQPASVPVDTHMFQIAAQKYLPHLKTRKTVTDKVYAEIANHFRSLYGDYAGWAHSVLFSADLKRFQQQPSHI